MITVNDHNMRGYSTRVASLVQRRRLPSSQRADRLVPVAAPHPTVTQEIPLINGDEALGRLAMMQFSLQFMIWQQHRKRWEGIVASAIAHIEGFGDLECLSQEAHPDEWALDDIDQQHRYTASIGATPILDVPCVALPTRSPPEDDARRSEVVNSITAVIDSQVPLIGDSRLPIKSELGGIEKACTDPAQMRTKGAEPTPRALVPTDSVRTPMALVPIDSVPTSRALVPTDSVRTPMALVPIDSLPTPMALVPTDSVRTPRALMPTDSVPTPRAPVHTDGVPTATESVPTPIPDQDSVGARISAETAAPGCPKGAVAVSLSGDFTRRLDRALYSGAAVSRHDGRRMIVAMLQRSGGYAEVMRRRRLWACEMGLDKFVDHRTSSWRQGQIKPSPAAASRPMQFSKHTLINKLQSSQQWGGDAEALFGQLAALDPLAASEQLAHLAGRFGRAVRDSDSVKELRCILNTSDDAPNDKAQDGLLPSSGTPLTKFQRARLRHL